MSLKKIILIFTILLSLNGVVSAGDANDISSVDFQIDVTALTPGGAELITTSAEVTIENFLKRAIERFIIAIGTIALFAMIIGAGQMILYAGEDERLTKGKTIFTGGLVAVGIALLSGLMVQLIAYLLYI